MEEQIQLDIGSLIHKGGVIDGVSGTTPEEIYANVCKVEKSLEGLDADKVYEAICAREKILSTAVGDGIAFPHARAPIIKNVEDQRIIVVYLKNPIDMKAPDENKVRVMFVLLTQNPQTHLKVLSSLATLIRKPEFKKLLGEHANEEKLINAIKELG